MDKNDQNNILSARTLWYGLAAAAAPSSIMIPILQIFFVSSIIVGKVTDSLSQYGGFLELGLLQSLANLRA